MRLSLSRANLKTTNTTSSSNSRTTTDWMIFGTNEHNAKLRVGGASNRMKSWIEQSIEWMIELDIIFKSNLAKVTLIILKLFLIFYNRNLYFIYLIILASQSEIIHIYTYDRNLKKSPRKIGTPLVKRYPYYT